MSVTIINADVMDGLRSLADESVHCVVTSPPYWGLRDYGVDGQIGLEQTFPEFITRLVVVFDEVRRVLRSDGVCFVNMGDAYAGSWGAQSRGDEYPGGLEGSSPLHARKIKAHPQGQTGTGSKKRTPGLKPKDLIGQPWRLAFALQDAGWWLRQDIIWHKPNPMPESVTDRCTKSHEYIFLLTKSARYFWDAEAIKEQAIFEESRNGRVGAYQNRAINHEGDGTTATAIAERDLSTRNKRSVWTIATAPFAEAHFATFPPELPEICIKAGSKPGDTVLDPFGGAGTTGLVADRLQRNAILIELNPQYAAMASKRVATDRGGLLDLMEA